MEENVLQDFLFQNIQGFSSLDSSLEYLNVYAEGHKFMCIEKLEIIIRL